MAESVGVEEAVEMVEVVAEEEVVADISTIIRMVTSKLIMMMVKLHRSTFIEEKVEENGDC